MSHEVAQQVSMTRAKARLLEKPMRREKGECVYSQDALGARTHSPKRGGDSLLIETNTQGHHLVL